MYIDSFLDYLSNEKRFSVHTIRSYQTDLEQFAHYLEAEFEVTRPKDVGYQLVRTWVVSLMETGHEASTVNRKISSLKTWFRFLMREKLVKENPMSKITAPKIGKRLPVFVEQRNMNLLFDEIDFADDFEGVRDRLILELFYYTGMRLIELINLQEADVDLHTQSLKVLGKRNKERIIPFGPELKQSVSNYLQIKRATGFRNKHLFVTSSDKLLYRKLVYRLVNRYLSKVTTVGKKSPHVLRHTFATHMLNNGADLNAIKELLGHANLSATQIYTHNSFEQLKSIYNQAHPRA